MKFYFYFEADADSENIDVSLVVEGGKATCVRRPDAAVPPGDQAENTTERVKTAEAHQATGARSGPSAVSSGPLVRALPEHPSVVLQREVLDRHGLSIPQLAHRLGVEQTTVKRLRGGVTGISPNMDQRLAREFGYPLGHWLDLQDQYDQALHGTVRKRRGRR